MVSPCSIGKMDSMVRYPLEIDKIQIVFWDAALSTISDRLDYHTFSRGLL